MIFIMKSKKSQFPNRDNYLGNLDDLNNFPTIADLMKEQNVSNDDTYDWEKNNNRNHQTNDFQFMKINQSE